ncbi:MAG: hypothetical protein P8Y60_19030 [Calditrichota bacterium]
MPKIYKNWLWSRSRHLVYYYRPDSYAANDIQQIMQVEEQALAHIQQILAVQYDDDISIYIYNSRDDAGWQGAHAYSRTETVDAIYAADQHSIGLPGVSAHELAHVITWNGIGDPMVQVLSEGVAVAMDGVWHSRTDTITNLDRWAEKFLVDGSLSLFSDLIRHPDDFPSGVLYPVSGSFVTYLLEIYPVDQFKQLFARATPENFQSVIQEIYGKPYGEIVGGWQESVRTQ